MKSKAQYQLYWEVYKQAHNNAVDLVEESKLLFKNQHYPRAYFLAYTALEEISKSQHAADVYTGFTNEKDFAISFTNHKRKIKRVGWTYYEAKEHPTAWVGPDLDDVEQVGITKPLWQKRLNSLYVGINNSMVNIPNIKVTKEDARGIIHIAKIALQQIVVTTEYHGHQIGTKGFLK
jgi:AbiV family abortive infection protein